jgi:trehalose-6-phosphatase
MTSDEFARSIAERKGITVEEHLRRCAEERKVQLEIAKEEGLDQEDEE